jgi:catechol 2,3-dioxygenase-like lactoylglutathione lyase family enzyme
MAELPSPPEGIVLTHFIVSDDVERSRRFYTEVLGGRVAFPGNPVNIALANSWIVINGGGGRPTTSLRSSWRRRVIPTGSAASLTSGLKASRLCTPNGAPGVLNS